LAQTIKYFKATKKTMLFIISVSDGIEINVQQSDTDSKYRKGIVKKAPFLQK